MGWSPNSMADEPAVSESQVKAAFIFNFSRYAEWPAEAFAATNSPYVIAAMGESPVAAELQKVVTGRTVDGRPIVVKRVEAGDQSFDCHILFIPATESKHAANLSARLKNKSILTVGETDTFLENGGCINLARRNQKIALEVNLEAAETARIKISSKLLNVARLVKRSSN